MTKNKNDNIINRIADAMTKAPSPGSFREMAVVHDVRDSVVLIRGFAKIQYDECVLIGGKFLGIVITVRSDLCKAILLTKTNEISVGDTVERTHKTFEIPVGESLIGRVINGVGEPLDELGPIRAAETLPVERPAKPIMERQAVSVSLETGIKVIDAIIPIGRGQRELILGDRQTGKTSVALDTIIHQKNSDVICIYCSIGQRDAAVANAIGSLKEHGAMDYTVVVNASGTELPGQQYIAPYAATSIAEYFMEQGKNVLIVYDDLTKHARAYREVSLLLERTPGREAYPADIFYVHSRLLERSTNMRLEYGGGSITSLPIIETEAENLAAYIPTNVISITDGQVYMSPMLFQRGQLPAIDAGRSVSRVGSKAQVAAYKQAAGTLGVEYSQFEELEMFSRFATKLDDITEKTISRGRRIREILKQNRYDTIPTEGQIGIFLCLRNGVFDKIDISKIKYSETIAAETMLNDFPEICKTIRDNKKIGEKAIKAFVAAVENKITDEDGDTR